MSLFVGPGIEVVAASYDKKTSSISARVSYPMGTADQNYVMEVKLTPTMTTTEVSDSIARAIPYLDTWRGWSAAGGYKLASLMIYPPDEGTRVRQYALEFVNNADGRVLPTMVKDDISWVDFMARVEQLHACALATNQETAMRSISTAFKALL